MPRLPRIDVPGLPQHLVQRGIDRQPCFFSDEDRRRYLADLREIALKLGCVQMATIDAVIAQLWIRHDLTLLSTDADFRHAARFCLLRNWRAASDCSPARLSRSIETTRVLRSS